MTHRDRAAERRPSLLLHLAQIRRITAAGIEAHDACGDISHWILCANHAQTVQASAIQTVVLVAISQPSTATSIISTDI
jgi:hypothetical protein